MWPSSSKPASIKYFKDHNYRLLTYFLCKKLADEKKLFSSCSIMRKISFVITDSSLKGPHQNLSEQKKVSIFIACKYID